MLETTLHPPAIKTKKILVALSGGVDSSVAVYLLADAGYSVGGATMKFHINHTIDKTQDENIAAASAICDKLGIPHYVFDFTDEFKKEVLDYFVGSYENAETPNPCFICNRMIKFGAFLRAAERLGFDAVATGHYAKVQYDANLARYRLFASHYAEKDQSYFLSGLKQTQLAKIIFPLQDLTKPEVKKIAAEKNIAAATQKESQDICFVEDGDYTKVIEAFSTKTMEPGNFYTCDGQVVGKHKGIFRYTIGQRRGLHVSLGNPVYVLEKNLATNAIIVAERDALYCTDLIAGDLNFIAGEFIEMLKANDLVLTAKTRYRSTPKKCRVEKLSPECFETSDSNVLKKSAQLAVHFLEKDFAVAIGQVLVLYNGDEVIASGIIRSTTTEHAAVYKVKN